MVIFADRAQAGQYLADELEKLEISDPVVITLPRGGVPVGFEIARRLKAPLDVVVIRKIGFPENPEFGIGAVSENGDVWVSERFVPGGSLSELELRILVRREEDEIQRRIQHYRNGRSMEAVQGRNVLLIDDGLATGSTARVAIRTLKKLGARQVILAAPVGAPDTVRALKREADEVICLEQPEGFYAVGAWYERFDQTTDDEVILLLQQARAERDAEARGESPRQVSKEVEMTDGLVRLPGELHVPPQAKGVVIFAHGSGSSRHSPRNQEVARTLNRAGLATLLFDLLDPTEAVDRGNVFDIPLLASRLILAYSAIRQRPETAELPAGFFGASTGGGAALWAAASLKDDIAAVVSRGGRPDLAMERLAEVRSPTLLIVGGEDTEVIEMNRKAHERIPHSKVLIIAGATHLFEEPGALEKAASAASDWFLKFFEEKAIRAAA